MYRAALSNKVANAGAQMPGKVVTASEETVVQQRVVGVNTKLFQDHHILSDKNKIIFNHPLLKEIGYDLQRHRMYRATKGGGEVSTTLRTIYEGKHLDELGGRLQPSSL